MSSDRLFGLDADPPYRPNGRSDIQGVPSGNAVKHDKGARVFAVIAILLFACYFIGALMANAQEKSGSPNTARNNRQSVRHAATRTATRCAKAG